MNAARLNSTAVESSSWVYRARRVRLRPRPCSARSARGRGAVRIMSARACCRSRRRLKRARSIGQMKSASLPTSRTRAECRCTWMAGVDVLSFGATKGGALAAEAVIFFDPDRAADMPQQRKRGGHLFSKHRFLAAQIEAYLADDLWLKLARH